MKGKALTLIRAVIVSLFVAAVAAVGTPAQAARQASARPAHRGAVTVTTITVTVPSNTNDSFTLSSRTAPRGVVIFKITNYAHFRHDFSIKGRTSRVLTTGQSTTLRVTFLRKGTYPYKCTIDHHVQFGQHGVFTIT